MWFIVPETLSQLPSTHPVNTSRMIILRWELEREIRGHHISSPTAYNRIKKEFNLTGSRKSVLRQFSSMIEERLHAT